MITRIGVLGLLLLTSGCGRAPDERLVELFGGAQALEVVQNAETVTACRLVNPSWAKASLADYEMAEGPIDVTDAIANELRAALLDTDTYSWDVAKACAPNYGVRIRFQLEDDDVDVLFCFQCDVLGIYHKGNEVGGEDFDNARSQFVPIVQQIFPDDAPIQSLE